MQDGRYDFSHAWSLAWGLGGMGVSMGVSSWVEVVWHAGRWHQLGAAAHYGLRHAADPHSG